MRGRQAGRRLQQALRDGAGMALAPEPFMLPVGLEAGATADQLGSARHKPPSLPAPAPSRRHGRPVDQPASPSASRTSLRSAMKVGSSACALVSRRNSAFE